MDRLRHLTCFQALSRIATLLACAALAACDEQPAPKAASGRFAAVKADAAQAAGAAAQFCDQSFPAAGSRARAFALPPARAIDGHTPPAAPAASSWRWVNLWATWCKPCVEEFPLLARWQETLGKDGLPLALELVSIDDDGPALAKWVRRPMPGRVHWLRSQDDLPALLASLGLDASSAIPIHALVDSAGHLRCVRVGAVREGDYAAIRAILAGP